MLFVKKCQSAFQARGKRADTLLPRQGRQRADADGAAREKCGGDTLETHAPLTSGFFSREPPGPAWTRTSLEGARCLGAFWGEREQLQKKGNQAMSEPGSSTNITRTALDTEEAHPGRQGTI